MDKIEIKTGETILAKFPIQMKTLKQLISAPPDILQESYLNPLIKLAEYLQWQPVSVIDQTPIIERQLNDVITILKIRRGKLLPEQAEIETIAAQEAVWSYALFTVGLLNQIEIRLKNKSIHLFNQHGERLGDYLPLTGFFYEAGAYYTIEHTKENGKSHFSIAPSLLRAALIAKLFPPAAMQWIGQYQSLSVQWQKTIFLLQGEENVLDRFLKEITPTNEIKKIEDQRVDVEEKKEHVPKVQENPGSIFFEKLSGYLKEESIFLIQSGLFIEENQINQIAKDHEMQSDELIQFLMENQYVIKNKQGNYSHTLTSKNISKRVSMTGYIFDVNALCESLQAEIKGMKLTAEFSENLSL